MRKLLLAAALALASTSAIAPAARAQPQMPADAIGHPLPAPDLSSGTVQVKVIAGSMAKPVADADVHFSIGGVDHVARTNAEGHATLPNVAAGALVKAAVSTTGPDGKPKDVATDEFPMPADGGVKLLLTTEPMAATPGPGGPVSGMGGGGPMAGGRPEPRMMSGKGRPDQAVDPGTLIATVTYDDLADLHPPAGVPITCIGYSDEHGVTAQTQPTDVSGRAMFTGLDRSGATAYFLLGKLPRANGVVDRLETIPPLQLTASAGWRVMMAGEKRDSGKPAVDELSSIEAPATVAAGKLTVSVAGAVDDKSAAELVDATTGKVLASAPLAPEPPANVQLQTRPSEPDAQLPVGSLGVQLMRLTTQQGVPVPATKIRLRAVAPSPWAPSLPWMPAPEPAEPGDVLAELESAQDGFAEFDKLPVGRPLLVEVTLGAETVRSTPLTLPDKSGAQVKLVFTWDQRGELTASFDTPNPNGTYLVQTHMFKKLFRSEPFQPVPDRGTAISILVYPRVFLQFELEASAEDDFLAVRGEMAVRNYSWTPYRGDEDGILVPLPDGFKGAGVMEDQEVAKDDAGFRIVHPLPPFGLQFHVGFSMPIHDREVHWDMPLPIGVFQGVIATRKFPSEVSIARPTGMATLQVEDDKEPKTGAVFTVMSGLTLMPMPNLPEPHLRFDVSGLPSPPTWKVLAPKIAGLLVIAMLLAAAAIAIAAARRSRARGAEAPKTARARKVEALYDELVGLEETGGAEARRAEIMAELEGLLAADRGRADA